MVQTLYYLECVEGIIITKQAAETTELHMKTLSLVVCRSYLEQQLEKCRTRF